MYDGRFNSCVSGLWRDERERKTKETVASDDDGEESIKIKNQMREALDGIL